MAVYNVPPYNIAAYGPPPPGYGAVVQSPVLQGVQPPMANQMPPTAPPMDISGYEGLTLDGLPAAPPPYEETETGPPIDRPRIQGSVLLTEEDVKYALAQFVSEHCCYGKKPVEECKLDQIEPACAYHYTLETYAERRDTCWVTEPFDGQVIDGPFNGPAPPPWQVQIFNKLPPFQGGTISCQVPHTASVKPCHDCLGMGRKPCHHCMSMGKIRCPHCHGHNHHHRHHQNHHDHHSDDEHDDHCMHCDGCGWKTCFHCSGSGQMKCETCKGKCQLKWYIKLTVIMTNHTNELLVDKTMNSNLPSELIKEGQGQMAFEEEAARVWPMPPHFPEIEIVNGSRQLVDQHNTSFPQELIHRQRQRVRIIPVSRVYCTYKNDQKEFYVFGLQNKVYFPDYYSKCCGCCCTIL